MGTGTTAVVLLAEEGSGAFEDCSAAEDSEPEAVFDGAGWLCSVWLSPLEAGALPDWLSEEEGPAGEAELLVEGPGEGFLLDEGVADCSSDEVSEGAGAPLVDSDPDELWG